MFRLDVDQICQAGVHLTSPALEQLPIIEQAINECFVSVGETPIQRGRVIALRHTDKGGLSSAFSASLYMSKYADATNRDRLKKMLKAGHSFEPLRGESISFLFIGVGKPTYDHLVTYTIRQRRVCGGMRANAPWGLSVPHEAKDADVLYKDMMESFVRYQERVHQGESPQAARAMLPAGIILPPFQLDFSEEALAKNVFKQRLWQPGAQGETKAVVNEMFECCLAIDREKWEALKEAIIKPILHHRVMGAVERNNPPCYGSLVSLYELPEKSMWD